MATTNNLPTPDGCIEIGRVPNIRADIDQTQRITTSLKDKMGIIDIIPCNFEVKYSSMLSVENDQIKTDFSPNILYDDAITNFILSCTSYGLSGYEFVRCYLTDMSTVSDDMSNEYTKSIIDDAFSSLTSTKMGQIFQNANKISEGSGLSETGSILTNPGKYAAPFVGTTNASLIDLAAAVVTHGSRISFPKIWSSNTYSPNLNCNIKLVSPYGHPKAVNQFIIKPLAYLLILLSPSTTEGLITYKPQYLTIKSYGLTNLTLCYPAQINIRRGGDDSSYNKYNQPLTVDISITFNSVTEGFACFKDFLENTKKHPETDILKDDGGIALKSFHDDFDQPNALFPTLKSIINSFRPFKYPDKDNVKDVLKNALGENIKQSDKVGSAGGVVGELPKTELNLKDLKSISNFDSYIPPQVFKSSETELIVSSDENSSIFDIQFSGEDSQTDPIVIDLNNFTPNQHVTGFENTSNNTYVLKLIDDSKTKSIRVRNILEDSTPGIWSDIIYINEQSDTGVCVDIVPAYETFYSNIRWQLKKDNTTYGPYIGSLNNLKDVIDDEYKLQIIDLAANNILHEEDINTTSQKSKQIFIQEPTSKLKTTLTIPQDTNINNYSYNLISENKESILSDCYDNTDYDIVSDKYYYVVNYNNQLVQKQNPNIDNSVDLINNTIVNKTINIQKINNELKITSIS